MMAIPPDPSSFPAELKARPQWVRWKFIQKPGAAKPSKVPFHPTENRAASTDDPSTWGTFETATANVAGFDGVGYVFTEEDETAGIDLDDCIEDGQFSRDAEEILDRIHTYSEISPSQAGIKLFVKGRIPEEFLADESGRPSTGIKVPGFEIYQSRRYFTTTFQHLPGTPSECVNANGNIRWFIEKHILPRKTTGKKKSTAQAPAGHECDVPYPERLKRAAAYAAKMDPAISEDAGGRQTLVACQHIAKGFCLKAQDARKILEPWNAKCRPPWSEKDLRHKIDEAISKGTTVRQHQHLEAAEQVETPVVLEWLEPEPKGRPRLSDAALYGIAGDYIRVILPYTEADPAGILLAFLIEAGCSIGYGPYFQIGSTRHGVNEFGLLVGPTSTGRKGTAQDEAEYLFKLAGPEFAPRSVSGLASGEGLIFQVRDAVTETDEDGADTITDPGQPDKRLLVREAEYARPLKVAERPGQTLSPVVRLAWDGKTLENLTKNSPHRASEPHVCILGQITPFEGRRLVTELEAASGFLNRHIVVYVERDKLLPDGEQAPDELIRPIALRLQEALAFARTAGRMARTEAAKKQWRRIYGPLSTGRTGLCGAMTDRGVQHVARLSMIYALLDQQDQVDVPHLKAAVALWQYAEESVRFIFGGGLGDSVADDINAELLQHPEGLTRTEIMNHFRGHVFGARLDAALDLLASLGLARRARVTGKGRPAERWFSTSLSGQSGQSGESRTEAA